MSSGLTAVKLASLSSKKLSSHPSSFLSHLWHSIDSMHAVEYSDGYSTSKSTLAVLTGSRPGESDMPRTWGAIVGVKLMVDEFV